MKTTAIKYAFAATLVNLLLVQQGTAPAIAHHGWGDYDSTRVLTLTGTVREFTYQNPHASVRLESPGKTWLVVLARRSACRIAACHRMPSGSETLSSWKAIRADPIRRSCGPNAFVSATR